MIGDGELSIGHWASGRGEKALGIGPRALGFGNFKLAHGRRQARASSGSCRDSRQSQSGEKCINLKLR